MFYRFAPDVHAEWGITDDPSLPESVSFTSGRKISAALTEPLVFAVDVPRGARPDHLLGGQIPVVSDLLLQTLGAAGVRNVQTFPAVLRNRRTRQKWTGFHALNVLGMVDAVNLRASTYDTLMEGSDELPPLLVFTRLVFARSKVPELPLFRLPQSPTTMIMSEGVREALLRRSPEGGWGITAEEIRVK